MAADPNRPTTDDGRRYAVTGSPGAADQPVTVYGSADLARRLAEGNRLGVGVAFRRLDPDTPTSPAGRV
ncbi:MAG TPA: hypothetical protein VFB84_20920 [Micromonosporaceae bacterium]|nr:hypothetical protein [Micromonosporaceae bacterium]